MTKPYRDTLQIIDEILTICTEKDMIISEIAKKSGTNYHECKPYLVKMIRLRLIRVIDSERVSRNGKILLYCITKKGFIFQKQIQEWVKDDSS